MQDVLGILHHETAKILDVATDAKSLDRIVKRLRNPPSKASFPVTSLVVIY